MISTGYCPRGPFCAFAHIEQELKNQRAHSNSESSNSDYTLENFISNVLPNSKDADQPQQNGDVSATNIVNQNQQQFNNSEDYSSYIEIVSSNLKTNESSLSNTSHNSHSNTNNILIQNGTPSNINQKNNNLIIPSTQQSSSTNSNSSTATLLQQQMLASANSYTCKPIGSEREKHQNQVSIHNFSSQTVQSSQHVHNINSSSNQIINGSDLFNSKINSKGNKN